MAARVALWLGYFFLFLLFRADRKRRKLPSSALWIAGLWLSLIATRGPSFWLGGGQTSDVEGSPINSLVNGAMLIGSIVILNRRRFDWSRFFSKNKALVLLYSFFLLSLFWSELPLPTFKRVLNDLGNALVPLIILTEVDPASTLKTLYTRAAFVLMPMSVVAIRFFPAIGRQFSRAGDPMFTGLTTHKNSLGELSMILALVIIWDLLDERRKDGSFLKMSRWPSLVTLVISLYLLFIANSATAISCFFIGLTLLLLIPRLQRFKSAKQLAMTGICAALCVWTLNTAFNISSTVYQLLGRQDNLTGRTDIWEAIGQRHVNPYLGAGFRGFWESKTGSAIYKELDTPELITAHDGYIEVFLNGGVPALTLLVIQLLVSVKLVLNRVTSRDPLGPIALVLFIVALFNNVSESIFFIGDPLWFSQLLVTMNYSSREKVAVPSEDMVSNNECFADLAAGTGL